MVSGGILKAVLLLEIPMPKKTNKYIKGDNYKKLLERAEVLERIRYVEALLFENKIINRSCGFYSRKYVIQLDVLKCIFILKKSSLKCLIRFCLFL